MDGNLTKKNNLSILNLSPGGFGAEPGQVQHGSGEGSGEAARSSQWPGHPEDSRRRSGRLWCKAKSGLTDRRRFRRSFGAKPSQVQWVPEKAWEALVHSQVRFNRVSEKVPKKVEPDLALHQSLPDLRNFPNLTWLCTKASGTFSGTFSGTLLGLTWLCTKASPEPSPGPSPEPSREPSELSPEPR